MIFLTGEINSGAYERVVNLLEHNDRAQIIMLNSEGGDTYAANAIADAVAYNNTQVKATGHCMSSAILILAFGAKRYATANTWFMVHEGHFKAEGDPQKVAGEAIQAIKEEEAWYAALASKTKLSAAKWKELSRQTHYFDAKMALEYGLIDEII